MEGESQFPTKTKLLLVDKPLVARHVGVNKPGSSMLGRLLEFRGGISPDPVGLFLYLFSLEPLLMGVKDVDIVVEVVAGKFQASHVMGDGCH